MRNLSNSTRPPRLAAGLVALFASADKAESLLGDLCEEFSDIARKSGRASARRWYWRQAAKTIAHLARAGITVAPLSVIGVVLLGFLLPRLSVELPDRLIYAILRAQRPYSNLHYDFYLWLLTWGFLIARIVVMTLVGCIVAAMARGREIVATIALIAIAASVVFLNFFLHRRDLPPHMAILWNSVLPNLENWFATLLGATLIQESRSAYLRRYPTP